MLHGFFSDFCISVFLGCHTHQHISCHTLPHSVFLHPIMSFWAPSVLPFSGSVSEDAFEWKKKYLQAMERGGWNNARTAFFDSFFIGDALEWYQHHLSNTTKVLWSLLSAAFDTRWIPTTSHTFHDLLSLHTATRNPWNSLHFHHRRHRSACKHSEHYDTAPPLLPLNILRAPFQATSSPLLWSSLFPVS